LDGLFGNGREINHSVVEFEITGAERHVQLSKTGSDRRVPPRRGKSRFNGVGEAGANRENREGQRGEEILRGLSLKTGERRTRNPKGGVREHTSRTVGKFLKGREENPSPERSSMKSSRSEEGIQRCF